MVTGQPPFTGEPLSVVSQHIHAAPAPPSQHVALPRAMEHLILGLLAKSPDDRPGSARAVREELRQIADGAAQAPIAVEPAVGAPFVGRSEEIERIRGSLEDAIAGHGRLVLVAGEPGIGKTRIAERSCAFARARDED